MNGFQAYLAISYKNNYIYKTKNHGLYLMGKFYYLFTNDNIY